MFIDFLVVIVHTTNENPWQELEYANFISNRRGLNISPSPQKWRVLGMILN